RCPRGAPPSIGEQPLAVLLASRAQRSSRLESCGSPPQRAANAQPRGREQPRNPPDRDPGGNELDNERVPLPPGHGVLPWPATSKAAAMRVASSAVKRTRCPPIQRVTDPPEP